MVLSRYGGGFRAKTISSTAGADAAQEDDAVFRTRYERWIGVCDAEDPWASV